MRLKAAIISIISVLLAGAVGIGLYCAWPAIRGTINDQKYYTAEDLKNSYDTGYETGCKTETELVGQVKYYKDIVDEYYAEVNTLNSEIALITKNNNDNNAQIATLTSIKADNERTIERLNRNIQNNENLIEDLNQQLQSLQNTHTEDANENTQLRQQIINLQNLSTQLQSINEINRTTINSLNSQILNLNNQITELNSQINNNSGQASVLNNRIRELEKSVSYYEQYIAGMESVGQVVATFEFDNSVYNIQILNSEGYASVTDPVSTNNVIFNYWTVDNQQVDLSTYKITTNTKFVANVTYRYTVNFVVDDNIINTQYITKNSIPTKPENPFKDGYEFDGWSVDGINIVDVDETGIETNTTYTAIFTKLHTVVFRYEEDTVDSQIIRNGNYVVAPSVDSSDYKVFNGWKVNGVLVDLSSYKITMSSIFEADIIYCYDVDFIVDDENYDHQIVAKNSYVLLPTVPVKNGYEFNGWTLNGEDVVNPSVNAVSESVTYIAKFTMIKELEVVNFSSKFYALDGGNIWSDGENTYYSGTYVFDKENDAWLPMDWHGLKSITGKYVWCDNGIYYYSNYSSHYVLDKANQTWIKIEWNGLSKFYGSNVWTDGVNTYYSSGSGHYILDRTTLTWNPTSWNGLTSFNGFRVWTDGTNIYYSNGNDNYQLDVSTSTWSKKQAGISLFGNMIWPIGDDYYYMFSNEHYRFNKSKGTWVKVYILGMDGSASYGEYVWTDGTDIYYSYQSRQYKLDRTTMSWVKKEEWNITSFAVYGSNVWTDGTDYYYSNEYTQCVLDKATKTWLRKEWIGEYDGKTYAFDFNASEVWTDGNNFYRSDGLLQYVLDKSTGIWHSKTWEGLKEFDGRNVWSDGDNYYYSSSSKQYILDKSTLTWNPITWNGYSSISGYNIWELNGNYYYSLGSASQYILDKTTRTWNKMTWNGCKVGSGSYIWKDTKGNAYFSDNKVNYVLNQETNTWEEKLWGGEQFYASYVWNDGDKCYMTKDSQTYLFINL